jgi:hypothetical protein
MINIYKMTCETGKTYYGSTKQTLKKRLQMHNYIKKCSCKDFINPKIELLETCEKEQQKQRESYYIRNFECVNIRIEDRTFKEWRKDYKKIHNENQKKWYEKNREKKLKQKKEYYEKNKKKELEKKKETTTCECGVVITKCHLLRHKKSNKHKINISVLNKNISI